MKRITLTLLSALLLNSAVFAIEASPAQTEDQKKAEEIVKKNDAKRISLNQRREELKKKHQKKKKAKAEKAAADFAAGVEAKEKAEKDAKAAALNTINEEAVKQMKEQQKIDSQREDKTH